MMKQLPKQIKLGAYTFDIKVLPENISSEVCEEEGSFHARIRTIYIAEDIVKRGGEDLLQLLLHELCHCIYWVNNLKSSSSEEDVVNAMSNGITELLSRTTLKKLINQLLR